MVIIISINVSVMSFILITIKLSLVRRYFDGKLECHFNIFNHYPYSYYNRTALNAFFLSPFSF